MKLVVLLLALTFLIFQNCSDASFSQGQEAGLATATNDDDLNTGFGEDADEDELGDYEEIDKSCARPNKQAEITIRFPNPGRTCAFGSDGNLSIKDRYFRGRIEQEENLHLPKGAIICDAEFDFVKQNFRYDDYFTLLFNDSVIASSYNFREDLTVGNFGLLQYNWNEIRGIDMRFGSAYEMIFCPTIKGASSFCSFPGHDSQGHIQLDYDHKFIKAIMSNGVPENHSFTMVTFGDNDNLDCEHSDVEFTVKVNYVD